MSIAPIGIFTSTKEGTLIDANQTLAGMFGYASSGEMIKAIENIGQQLYSDPEERENIIRKLEKGDERIQVECRLARKNGSFFWAINDVRAVRDKKGNIVHFRNFFSDTTERKLAEDALSKSEEKFRFLAEAMTDIVWTLDLNLKTTYVSPSIEKILGFTPEERIKQEVSEIMTPESHTRALGLLVRELEIERIGKSDPERSRIIDIEYYDKSGNTVWMENMLRGMRDRNGKLIGLHGVSRDISERKKAEDALRVSEHNFRRSLDDSPLGIRIVSRGGKTLYVNQSFLDLFEYADINEMKTSHITDRYTKKSLHRHMLRKEERRRKRDTSGEYEIELITSANMVRYLWVRRKRVLWNGARHYQVIYQDITKLKQTESQRKQALEKLRDSRDRLQGILDNSPLLISEFDGKGRYTTVNRAICALYGKEAKDLVGKSFHELLPPDTADAFMRRLARVIERRVPIVVEDAIPVDGKEKIFRTTLFPVLDIRGTLRSLGGIAQDITELREAEITRRELEKKIQQAEKISSLSRISAGVAHEILNPLGIISLELQLIEKNGNLHQEDLQELAVCKEQVERIVAITENLKQFSRTAPDKMAPDDINGIVGEVLRLYATQLKIEGVVTDIHSDASLPVLQVDRKKMEQVFINLLTNALAAMENKKDKFLRIETKKIASEAGERVRIVVSDTGTGIEEKHLHHIFEPFYTTRGIGKGTGMGLSISHGIIEQHGGRIWAENNKWGGSSFYIELPLT
jgi:PAS domain S-box-containing protein